MQKADDNSRPRDRRNCPLIFGRQEANCSLLGLHMLVFSMCLDDTVLMNKHSLVYNLGNSLERGGFIKDQLVFFLYLTIACLLYTIKMQ